MRDPASRFLRGLLAAACLGIAVAPPAFADQQRTGSHLNSHTARPTALYLNEPSAIDQILQLIQSRRHSEALALAEHHVDSLRSMLVDEEPGAPNHLYFALNALCVARTAASEVEQGIESCSEAIALDPRHWSAWNSRGTAHFADENFDAASEDFLRALALAPRSNGIVETLQRNVRLALERQDETLRIGGLD